MSLIEVEGLVKHYGRVKALRDVGFKVESGVTGLIGPNGAGKSTLIKILLGLISAKKGTIAVFGLDCWKDRNKILERVGVLHEKPRFPSLVTGREYLEYVAKLKGTSKVNEEVERISEICGLAVFVDRKIGTFSAGMVQRLGLANALIGEPELVILDEPTANLDPLGRMDILTKIKRLRDEEGINFLVSTHILSELERVCDSVVILNEGVVLTYGPLSELTSEYASPKYMIKVDNPQKLLKSVSKKTMAKLEPKGEFILANTEDPDSLVEEINSLVKQGIITLKELKLLTPNLEDIFVEVMRRKSL